VCGVCRLVGVVERDSIQFLVSIETIGVEEILSERMTLMPRLPIISATFSANS